MEIRRVEYTNVYGSLSGKLDFSRGENFLVGINGCGKTTVLNIIRWVLGPCYPELLTLQHDLISIDLKHGKYLYSIQSRILKKKHELKVITKDKSRKFNPIKTTLAINSEKTKGSLEEARELYKHLVPVANEVGTWSFLKEELPSPIFIGLERNIEEKPATPRFRPRKYVRTMDESAPRTNPIALMRDAFNTSRRILVEINDELNRKVLELSFSGVLSGKFSPQPHSADSTKKKIQQLKDRFVNTTTGMAYPTALSSPEVRSAAVAYLDELSSLLLGVSKEDELWVMLNQHNFDRAASMFKLFQDHESKTQEAQLEITRFSEAVNMFIGDSGKSIHFNNNTGIPYFKTRVASEMLTLSELSSGEAQMVVLLSYFAFLAKTGIPIIVDEPEISLHVQWQKYFVKAVKKVMPEECQTIMATHSPEICGADGVNVQSISVRVT